MAIETRFARVMVTEVDPLTVPEVAVIVAEPAETPLTTPLLLTVAMVESELDQRTLPVRVFWLPSSKVPVAVIWKVPPCWMEGVAGPTVTVVRLGFTKNPLHPTIMESARSVPATAKNCNFRL